MGSIPIEGSCVNVEVAKKKMAFGPVFLKNQKRDLYHLAHQQDHQVHVEKFLRCRIYDKLMDNKVYEKFERDRKDAINGLNAKKKGCVKAAESVVKFGKKNKIYKPEIMLLESHIAVYKQRYSKEFW